IGSLLLIFVMESVAVELDDHRGILIIGAVADMLDQKIDAIPADRGLFTDVQPWAQECVAISRAYPWFFIEPRELVFANHMERDKEHLLNGGLRSIGHEVLHLIREP